MTLYRTFQNPLWVAAMGCSVSDPTTVSSPVNWHGYVTGSLKRSFCNTKLAYKIWPWGKTARGFKLGCIRDSACLDKGTTVLKKEIFPRR